MVVDKGEIERLTLVNTGLDKELKKLKEQLKKNKTSLDSAKRQAKVGTVITLDKLQQPTEL